MSNIESFTKYKEQNTPHIVHEVVCLKCLHRCIACYPQETLLKDLECNNCGETGYIIATGQNIIGEDV